MSMSVSQWHTTLPTAQPVPTALCATCSLSVTVRNRTHNRLSVLTWNNALFWYLAGAACPDAKLPTLLNENLFDDGGSRSSWNVGKVLQHLVASGLENMASLYLNVALNRGMSRRIWDKRCVRLYRINFANWYAVIKTVNVKRTKQRFKIFCPAVVSFQVNIDINININININIKINIKINININITTT
jgi:hypothetical protein